VGEEGLEKVEDLVRIVNRYQPEPEPLHVIYFGKIQEKIALVTNPKMRTILYRRMMIRIANRLAKTIKAKALVTGESLGQVASQTVENLATINAVSELPILRPLITFDKDEIIERAHKWGTFETSIRPASDCCTLFADRHPCLRASLALIEQQETRFSVMNLVEEALASLETRWVKSNRL
jgi:thiamine biosynthesis protein ThiI